MRQYILMFSMDKYEKPRGHFGLVTVEDVLIADCFSLNLMLEPEEVSVSCVDV